MAFNEFYDSRKNYWFFTKNLSSQQLSFSSNGFMNYTFLLMLNFKHLFLKKFTNQNQNQSLSWKLRGFSYAFLSRVLIIGNTPYKQT